MSFVRLVRSSGEVDTGGAPVGGLRLDARILKRDRMMVGTVAEAGVDYFLDPVLATATPRGAARAGLTATVVPDWMAGVGGEFATPIRLSSLPGNPDETAFALTGWLRRRATDNIILEIGGRWADRGPAFAAPGFRFHQRQNWIYLTLTYTTEARRRWSQPRAASSP
jgi:hypothetical protein